MRCCFMCNDELESDNAWPICNWCRIEYGYPEKPFQSNQGGTMLFTTLYDTQNTVAPTNVQTLMLMLDKCVDVNLPNGQVTEGILRDIQPFGEEAQEVLQDYLDLADHCVELYNEGRLVELTFEIDDAYEALFYVNHSARDMSLIREEC